MKRGPMTPQTHSVLFPRGTFLSPWQFSHSELPRAIFGFHGHFFAKLPRSPKFAVIYFFSVAKFCAHFYPWQIWLVICHGRFFGFHGHFFQNCHGLQKVPREKKNADSRYASAACLPRSRNDANSHSVMPQLCVLSVRLSGNERYYF